MNTPPPTPLLLLGGGGHALVVWEAARARNQLVLGCFDDNPQPPLARKAGVAWLGTLAQGVERLAREPHVAPSTAPRWMLALGALAIRRDVLRDAGALPTSHAWATLVHPSAVVAPSATLEPGVFVGAGAIVQAFATLRAHAIINSGAIIEHECDVGVGCHIAPGSVLCGNVRVESASPDQASLLGAGCRVLPGVRIGADVTIGAGSVVLRDVRVGTTLVGVGPKPIRAE